MSILKIFYILILALTISISCTEDADEVLLNSDCNSTVENPDWTRERFNSTHTIMFPDTYKGGINQEINGTTYKKTRNDDKIIIFGGFCDAFTIPCTATDYIGEGIESNIDSITYTNLSGILDYLNKKITICRDQKDIAYFFYTNSNGGTFRDSYGRLFLNDISDSSFKMAGIIEFSNIEHQEVIDIIGTIKQE